MKKPIIAFVVLLIAAGGSVGGFLAVKSSKDKETKQAAERLADNKLFSFDPYSPTKVVFSKGSESYTAESDGENWTLDSGEFALDQTYLQLICTYMSDLTADDSYGKITDEKLEMYGLKDADRIELTEPTGTHTIYIGDLSPTGDFYYLTADGKDNIYTVDAQHGSVLKLDRLLLKDKHIMPYSLYDIKSITTYDSDGNVLTELDYDSAAMSWSLPDEYSDLTLDQTKVTSYLNNLARLEAEEMLDEKLDDLSKYGFDKPAGRVVLEGLDGSEHEFLVSINEDDPTYCFALVDGEQVELYFRDDLDIVNAEPIKYIAPNYIAAGFNNVKSFTFDFGEYSDSCELDLENGRCVYNGKELSLNAAEVYSSFNNFFNAFSVFKLTGTDIKSQPKLESPVLTVEYTLSEEEKLTMQLVKGEGSDYYVFRNGKYIGAYVDETMLTGRNSLSDFSLKFRMIAGI